MTVIEVRPVRGCATQNNEEKDGYDAFQLGYVEKKASRKEGKIKRGDTGHRGRSEAKQPSRLQVTSPEERRWRSDPSPERSSVWLAEGEEPAAGSMLPWLWPMSSRPLATTVKVQGKSKGRGFSLALSSVTDFKGQKASHGQKIHRKPASNGATDPGAHLPRRPSSRSASATRTSRS